MAKFPGGRLAALALSVTALLTVSGALAQSVAPPRAGVLPTPERLNPASEAQAQPKQREADLLAPPEFGPCPLRSSTLTFKLGSVEINGSTAASAKELASAYASLIGRTISVAAICDIRDRASAIIFRKGILARVNIPEQHIDNGHLTLEVIEARIASIRVHGDGGPGQAKVEDYLERLRGLTPFNLRTAQRYLLLASDVPGMRVVAALRPSSQGAGAVDMDVTVSREPIDALVDIENFGSKSLGRFGGLARADFNGFTPFGERTTLIAYSTLFDDEQQVIQLVEEGRFGSSGLLGRLSVAYGTTHPGDTLTPLNLQGRSLVASLQARYPLIRSRRDNLNLEAGIDYVDQRTDFGTGGGSLTNDRLRIAFVRVEGEARRVVLGLDNDFTAGLEARQGVAGLGASRPSQADLSRFQGRADAFVARADAHLLTQFDPKLSIYLSAQGQFSDKPLLSYEQLAIGNLTIGRGYDPSSVEGDQGVAGSAEIRLGPFRYFKWLNVSTYGFYDVAYVRTVGINGDDREVQSVGAGLRIKLTNHLSLDAAYVHPFDRISLTAERRAPERVLFSLVATYP